MTPYEEYVFWETGAFIGMAILLVPLIVVLFFSVVYSIQDLFKKVKEKGESTNG